MKGSEHIILPIGEWDAELQRPLTDTKMTGREIAYTTIYRDQTNGREGTSWELYRLTNGKYLLWWEEWEAHGNHTSVADYAILDELPKPGVRYEGTLYSFDGQFRSPPVPAELIEIVKEEI